MTRDKHRSSVPDRARRRAIRAHATRLGVSYSVAARLLRAQSSRGPAEFAAAGPAAADDHRAWMFAVRERRRFAVRVRDTRMAADLPLGRAKHLVERFPAGGGRADNRETLLGLLYLLLAVETPAALPDPAELAWVAELGEEDAVDFACAATDRAARLLLDGDRWRLWTRVEAALATALANGRADGADRADRADGAGTTDWRRRDAARTLDREFRTVVLRHSVDDVRELLDAVLG